MPNKIEFDIPYKTMLTLPPDILRLLSTYLDFRSKTALRSTCSKLRKYTPVKEISYNLHARLTDDILTLYPNLITLYANFNPKVTDEGLKHVPNLNLLGAIGNPNITAEGVKHLPNSATVVANFSGKIPGHKSYRYR